MLSKCFFSSKDCITKHYRLSVNVLLSWEKQWKWKSSVELIGFNVSKAPASKEEEESRSFITTIFGATPHYKWAGIKFMSGCRICLDSLVNKFYKRFWTNGDWRQFGFLSSSFHNIFFIQTLNFKRFITITFKSFVNLPEPQIMF